MSAGPSNPRGGRIISGAVVIGGEVLGGPGTVAGAGGRVIVQGAPAESTISYLSPAPSSPPAPAHPPAPASSPQDMYFNSVRLPEVSGGTTLNLSIGGGGGVFTTVHEDSDGFESTVAAVGSSDQLVEVPLEQDESLFVLYDPARPDNAVAGVFQRNRESDAAMVDRMKRASPGNMPLAVVETLRKACAQYKIDMPQYVQ